MHKPLRFGRLAATLALSPALWASSFLLVPAQAQTADLPAARAQLDTLLEKSYPALEALYKDIHAHPELGMQETRTAAILAGQLNKAGFTVTEGVGGTGVVGVFRNGDGPTILVRAEMDGLPMQEKTGLPWASSFKGTYEGKETFTAHACGHDLHMAWWTGAAQALVTMKDRWAGTLVFIAQPAEETLRGARAMLADGLLERFPRPDFGFAAHVSNQEAGTIHLRAGAAGAASDSYEITFHGRGGHGSMPSATIDPITMGAHFVSDVQTVISREKDAAAFGVLTVGAFNAGTAANIIPDNAIVKVNMRSHSEDVRSLLIDGMTRTAKASAMMARANEPSIRKVSGTAALINDASMAEQAAAVLGPLYGDRIKVVPATAPPPSASEDYSEFVAGGVPSLFFGIGGYDPEVLAKAKASGEQVPVNHSPFFAPIPEPTIKAGVNAIVMAIIGGVRPAAGGQVQ